MTIQTPLFNGVTPLLDATTPDSGWAVLEVTGVDATDYLQRQLTNDVAAMPQGEARLAAWCNAKGRMLASFIVVRAAGGDAGDTYLLLCQRNLLPGLLKKMQMFVLRSKVTLRDASEAFSLYGMMGETAQQHWQALQGTLPLQSWKTAENTAQGVYAVALYPAAVLPNGVATSKPIQTPIARLLCLQSRDVPAPAGATLDPACWQWGEAASGVATIGQACSEQFVPQMVNFESTGGVSFKKGCYPGQEVVARNQFRGAIKRRGQIATFACPSDGSAVQAGAVVWQVPVDAAAGDEPMECGMVVQAACCGAEGVAFASLQNTAAEAAKSGLATLHAGSADGVALQFHALPYALIDV